MPKEVVTKDSMPTILHVLDRWTLREYGKFTWERYADEVAIELDMEDEGIDKSTLQRYKEICDAVKLKRPLLKEEAERGVISNDETIELLLTEVETLKMKNERLKLTNNNLKEMIIRWQYNLYKKKTFDMGTIELGDPKSPLNEPLPKPVEEK